MKPALTLAFLFCASHLFADPATCSFDTNSLTFPGTPIEQARCLLRPVLRAGNLGPIRTNLPQSLENLIGQPVDFTYDALQNYLRARSILESDIGGPLTNHLNAKYFVIHDTSTPNYGDQDIPTNINTSAWSHNDLSRWQRSPVANMFVNRLGQSYTAHPWVVPWRATKLEVRVLGEKGRGLFVHTEMVQPRRRDPNGAPRNDAIAPEPGFSDAQIARLALLYAAASLEHGAWMIPAFHATVDAGIPNAHDDPQNFDLDRWAKAVAELIDAIKRDAPTK